MHSLLLTTCLALAKCLLFVDAAFIKQMSFMSNASAVDDIVELNVGGQKMATLRSTLTAIPNSKLALMFSKENMKQALPTDKQGAIFLDYNPSYFNYLLDQLRTIKRMPHILGYQLQFSAPFRDAHLNFTHMLVDLGLTPDQFLSPMEGTHTNLSISSLNGWQECYRGSYDTPFDLSVLTRSCNGSRILVACRSLNNRRVLTVAGIGEREDLLHPCVPRRCKANGKSEKFSRRIACSSHYQCITQAKRGVGWYHVENQSWGFVRGSLSFFVNPCDSSNLDVDYRLCWTFRKDMKISNGDRCGNRKNLQESNQWERLIYHIY